MSRWVVSAITALFVSISTAWADSDWISYKSPDGAFTVDMPSAPTVATDSAMSAVGAVPTTTYTNDDGVVGLMVMDGDLSNLQGTLDVEGAVKGILSDGRILKSETVVQLDGHEGRYVALSNSDGSQYVDVVYIVGRHIYQAMTAIPKDATPAQAAEAERFVQSFHFPTQSSPSRPY